MMEEQEWKHALGIGPPTISFARQILLGKIDKIECEILVHLLIVPW